MRHLLILTVLPLAGCSAIREIQANSEAIIGGVLSSASDTPLPQKVIEAVACPSLISVTEALLATVAALTGGVAGYVGVKRGVNLGNGNG